ncbi:BBE domain-containing protein [Streptomyces hirsutus]|uniref:BBE domain-containing protein n=1 Tax=Streptomyces hirsutus TaxID=35620 RepID=UPI003330FF06
MTDQSAGAGRESTRPMHRTARSPVVDALRQARDAVAREVWAEAYPLLRGLDPTRLTPDGHAAFADAAWWTGRVEESITQRTRAHAGYAAAGAERRAGYTAWMLFYEHQLAGRSAVAAGWLRRARRHLRDQPECVEQCRLSCVDTERSQERGAFDEAMETTDRMGTRANYRDDHARLVAVKRRYDPGNLFRLDHNIAP